MARPKPVTFDKLKIVAENRRARFDYYIEDTFEAGLALQGTEVKALRAGEASIAESYAEVKDGQVWLINANTLAAAIVLTGSSFADFGATAARWNVDHLDDPSRIDLCYLERLDDAALIPLIDLRGLPLSAELQDRVIYLGNRAHADLMAQQSDWRRWTLRGAWRLSEAQLRLGSDQRTAQPAPYGRRCGGDPVSPPPPPPPAFYADPPSPRTQPLTRTPNR